METGKNRFGSEANVLPQAGAQTESVGLLQHGNVCESSRCPADGLISEEVRIAQHRHTWPPNETSNRPSCAALKITPASNLPDFPAMFGAGRARGRKRGCLGGPISPDGHSFRPAHVTIKSCGGRSMSPGRCRPGWLSLRRWAGRGTAHLPSEVVSELRAFCRTSGGVRIFQRTMRCGVA